jgi:predicted secreted protein
MSLLCAPAALLLALAGQAFAQSAPVQVYTDASTVIELPGNPSTGYSWVLDDGASEGPEFVKVEDLGYAMKELKEGERPVLGAPQQQQFRISGLEVAHVKLVFLYVKSRDTPPAKTEEIAIEVVGD